MRFDVAMSIKTFFDFKEIKTTAYIDVNPEANLGFWVYYFLVSDFCYQHSLLSTWNYEFSATIISPLVFEISSVTPSNSFFFST
jgi:hypothetical protein